MLPRIVIFGASDTGKLAFQMLRLRYDIIAFTDNDGKKWGKEFLGVPVIPPQRIASFDAELIVTASIYHVEINRQLQEMGLKNIRLFQPSADRKEYRLLEVREGDPFRNCIRRKLEAASCEALGKKDKKEIRNRPPEIEQGGQKKKAQGNVQKKVLVIAYYFPPIGGAGVQRTLKFVKYLQEYGYEPVVLTAEPDPLLDKYPLDPSLLSDIPEDIQVVRIQDDFSWTDVISNESAQEITEFLYSVSNSPGWMEQYRKAQETQPFYLLPDKMILWANACVRRIEEYVNLQEIDLLYSTVPEWSPHLVAYFLKQKYGIKWAADYRDPWVCNEAYVRMYYPRMTKEEIKLDRGLENRLVREMDIILLAGGNWMADFVKSYDIEPERIKEITNGYDEEDFAGLKRKTKRNIRFTLCYNGGVAYRRDPIPVLRAVNSLIDEGEVRPEEIQWVFNGSIAGVYSGKMEQEDRYHIIVRNGILAHRESIEIGMQADIMVMYGECGKNGYLNYPGKFYEYLRIGRPILCFASADSYQAEVLQNTGLGVNLEASDIEGIKKFLKGQLERWREGREADVAGALESVRIYERRNLTRMLAEQFDRLVEIS